MYPDRYFDEWYGGRKADSYAWVLAELIAHGRPGHVVDLGAGTGLLTELAWRWGLSVEGYEGSQFAVESALARCPGLPIRQHALESALPIASDSVGTVVMNQVIEHLAVETASLVLAEVRRILRPGGRLFVFSPSRRNRYERELDPTHIRLLLPSELDQALIDAGMRPVRHLNAGFWFIPRSRVGMHLGRAALRAFPQDLLSATANAIAEKPQEA